MQKKPPQSDQSIRTVVMTPAILQVRASLLPPTPAACAPDPALIDMEWSLLCAFSELQLGRVPVTVDGRRIDGLRLACVPLVLIKALFDQRYPNLEKLIQALVDKGLLEQAAGVPELRAEVLGFIGYQSSDGSVITVDATVADQFRSIIMPRAGRTEELFLIQSSYRYRLTGRGVSLYQTRSRLPEIAKPKPETGNAREEEYVSRQPGAKPAHAPAADRVTESMPSEPAPNAEHHADVAPRSCQEPLEAGGLSPTADGNAAGAEDERKDGPPPTPPSDLKQPEPARHSPDFRSVHWHGTDHQFTKTQAVIVGILWTAWERGTPDVGNTTLLEAVDSKASRLVDIFRDHPAWGSLIVDGATKGSKRLAKPSAPAES